MTHDKPLCPDAWAIPPTPIMLKHGNDYHTCSKCGEPVETVNLKDTAMAYASDDEAISDALALIKYEIEYGTTHGGCPPRVEAIHRHGVAEAKAAIQAYTAAKVREALKRHDIEQRIEGLDVQCGEGCKTCDSKRPILIRLQAELAELGGQEKTQ